MEPKGECPRDAVRTRGAPNIGRPRALSTLAAGIHFRAGGGARNPSTHRSPRRARSLVVARLPSSLAPSDSVRGKAHRTVAASLLDVGARVGACAAGDAMKLRTRGAVLAAVIGLGAYLVPFRLGKHDLAWKVRQWGVVAALRVRGVAGVLAWSAEDQHMAAQ